jgi:hypothetical protein
MNKKVLFGAACLALIGALAFVGCDSNGDDGTDPSPSLPNLPGTWRSTDTVELDGNTALTLRELIITVDDGVPSWNFTGYITTASGQGGAPMPAVRVVGTFKDMGNDNFKAQITSLTLFAFETYMADAANGQANPVDSKYWPEADGSVIAEYNNKTAKCSIPGAGSNTLTITSTGLPVIPGTYTK